MYLMLNFPLDAQKITDQKRGIRILIDGKRAVRVERVLEWKSAHLQGQYMHSKKIQVGPKPREGHP